MIVRVERGGVGGPQGWVDKHVDVNMEGKCGKLD